MFWGTVFICKEPNIPHLVWMVLNYGIYEPFSVWCCTLWTHLIWEESSHSCSLFCLSQQEKEKEHIVFLQTICIVWASGCSALVCSSCQCGFSAEPLKGESSRPNKGQSMAACVCSQDCPTTSIVSFRITDSLCHMKGQWTDERERMGW